MKVHVLLSNCSNRHAIFFLLMLQLDSVNAMKLLSIPSYGNLD